MESQFFRTFVAMTAAMLLIGANGAARAEGETWVGGGAPAQGTVYFEINEVLNSGHSIRLMQHGPEGQFPNSQFYCPTFNLKPECELPKAAGKLFPKVVSLLPVCAGTDAEDCVQDLYISNADGQFIRGELLRTISGPTFAPDSALGLIEGSTAALFRVPGASNAAGTDTYVVKVSAQQDFNSQTGKFTVGEFSAFVVPYRETISDDRTVQYVEHIQSDGRTVVGSDGTNTSCVWNESGRCGVAVRYSEGQRVKLSFRATNKLAGWFSGRIKGPELLIQKFSPTANLFSISGAPVLVPQFRAIVPRTSTNSYVVKLLSLNPSMGGASHGANAPTSFEALEALKGLAGDSAVGYINPFSLTTVRGGSGCFADTSKVLGIVTTDAMVFEGSPPVFSNGQLVYKVAGVHFAPDRVTPIEGSYDLVMRSEVARCLYGFTSAPVQASISVLSEKGEPKVATTVVSESKGWLRLAAYGFNFSNPSIFVKLSQHKAQFKKTILCLRGKTVKKVTAINPTCPAGFKKK